MNKMPTSNYLIESLNFTFVVVTVTGYLGVRDTKLSPHTSSQNRFLSLLRFVNPHECGIVHC